MKLTIRTEKPEAEIAIYVDGEKQDEVLWQAHRELSDTILIKIDEIVKKDLSQLSGIVVFKGPGSFTGLRIGMTVANSLAYSLGIPIVATGGEDWKSEGISRLNAGENEKIAMPEYGGEANIRVNSALPSGRAGYRRN